jgi:regulator of sigma E protease
MIYLLAVFIVLGTLVFIHELGHYLAAKAFGVRVEVFSLGFGKRLLGFKRGGTDYRVSALPLGGYVKMAGENPLDESTGDPGEFIAKPRWQRLVIAAAGPAVNILFSVALLTGIYMVDYEHPAFLDRPAIIAQVEPGSPGASIGLAAGDQVTQIDGVKTPNWESADLRMIVDSGQTVHLTLQRNGQIIKKEFDYNQTNADPLEFLGIEPDQPLIVGILTPGFPAAKAGIQSGDEVLAVNGSPIHGITGLSQTLQTTKDEMVEIRVRRGEGTLAFHVVPEFDSTANPPRYVIGLRRAIHVDQLSFVPALRASLAKNREFSFVIIEVLQRLVQHRVSIRQMSGPIGIAQQSGEALREGPITFLLVMAMISLNLGIFNLLPIPILDGGLILLILIESVIRRDIRREIKELVYQAAFVFLVLFAVVVIYNDIAKTTLGQHLHLF